MDEAEQSTACRDLFNALYRRPGGRGEVTLDERGFFEIMKSRCAHGGVVNISGMQIGRSGIPPAIAVIRAYAPTSLLVQDNMLGDEGIALLMEYFSHPMCSVTHLNISSNNFGEAGAASLAQCLRSNTTLTHLELGSAPSDSTSCINNLNANAISNISSALESNAHLLLLGLTNISIGKTGVEGSEYLSALLSRNHTLQSCFLSANCLRTAGSILIIQALQHNTALSFLDLSDNEIGPDAGIALGNTLQANRNLTTLNLARNTLGPTGACSLSDGLKQNTALSTLNLESNGLGDWGAASIAAALIVNNTITHLNLANNNIGAEGGMDIVTSLRSHTAMVTLILNGTCIKDKAALQLASTLKNGKSLTCLEIGSSKIGPSGGIAIAKALEENTSLTSLRISNNFITEDAGCKMLESLKLNKCLTSIHITENQVSHTTIKQLKEICSGNLSAKQHKATAPLKQEIIRLRREQQKIPIVQADLFKQTRACSNAESEIEDTEAQIDEVKAFAETELKRLTLHLQEVDTQLSEQQQVLQQQESEFQTIQDQYDSQITELQLALQQELQVGNRTKKN
ncbi:Protein NLRC3 [Pelomyxa schiedti]|nr:Protein NLRC3 [Pelomyxa schiedti]